MYINIKTNTLIENLLYLYNARNKEIRLNSMLTQEGKVRLPKGNCKKHPIEMIDTWERKKKQKHGDPYRIKKEMRTRIKTTYIFVTNWKRKGSLKSCSGVIEDRRCQGLLFRRQLVWLLEKIHYSTKRGRRKPIDRNKNRKKNLKRKKRKIKTQKQKDFNLTLYRVTCRETQIGLTLNNSRIYISFRVKLRS